jgi:DNA-binding winged helix-turn-helix (wHTH) protein
MEPDMLSPVVKAEPARARLRFDRFDLDEADARLTCAGQPIALAPKPFAVLCALVRTPRMLVTKNALLDAVWGHRFVTESVLKSAISEVRAALGDDPKQPRFIETVSRRGYRFIGAPAVPSQSMPVAERSASLAVLTALCRGDAALADLIRTVAATLECA